MKLSLLSASVCRELQERGYRFLKFIKTTYYKNKQFALYEPVKQPAANGIYEPLIPAETNSGGTKMFVCI